MLRLGRRLSPRARFLVRFALILAGSFTLVAWNPVDDRLIVPFTALVARGSGALLAALLATFFNLLLVLLWVKFLYATQLGPWSLEHYSPFARNAWGLAKHLADLPLKLALPLLLWLGWRFPQVAGER